MNNEKFSSSINTKTDNFNQERKSSINFIKTYSNNIFNNLKAQSTF